MSRTFYQPVDLLNRLKKCTHHTLKMNLGSLPAKKSHAPGLHICSMTISNNDGDTWYRLTNRQYNKGRNVGKSIQQNCFVCQKYLKRNGDTLYNQTFFRCSLCKMPLCKKDRTDLCTGCPTSCLKEHQESNCKVVGCFGSDCTPQLHQQKKFHQHPAQKKEKLIQLLNRGVRKEMDPAQRNLQKIQLG